MDAGALLRDFSPPVSSKTNENCTIFHELLNCSLWRFIYFHKHYKTCIINLRDAADKQSEILNSMGKIDAYAPNSLTRHCRITDVEQIDFCLPTTLKMPNGSNNFCLQREVIIKSLFSSLLTQWCILAYQMLAMRQLTLQS